MALFPEMAMEHPPQCNGQGELSLENIAFLMLSRLCKQRQMYVVLGSVEERLDGCLYETCVALDKEGEIKYTYRKQSGISLGRAAGDQPGILPTEFGPVGILLGAEVEEEQRWQEILARKPVLILNPARARMQADPILLHKHPELLVTAWHMGMRRVERLVQARTRQCACSFVRADAPYQDGGAGTSILVEPHRTVLMPRWSAAFLAVDTSHPYELEVRKLPGWRRLSVEERASGLQTEGAISRVLMTQEEVQRGPRYSVWTLRPKEQGTCRLPQVGGAAAFGRSEVSASLDVVLFDKLMSFLVPLTAKDGRQMYCIVTNSGDLHLFDAKLRNFISSCKLGASGLNAVCAWNKPNQLIIASTAKGCTTLKIFEGLHPKGELKLDEKGEVQKHRRSTAKRRTMGHASSSRYDSVGSDEGNSMLKQRGKRVPDVKEIFHVYDAVVAVVFEPFGQKSGPTAKLIDMDDGWVRDIDIYGSGPPVVDDESDAEELDEKGEPRVRPPLSDKLVGVRLVEQCFKHRFQRVLACLYDSNRLVQATLPEGNRHEIMLVEEGEAWEMRRARADKAINFAVLPNSHSEAYHLLASYKSLVVRWWNVTLSSGKVQSHLTLACAINHLTVFDWPCPGGGGGGQSGISVEKPPGKPTGPRRRSGFQTWEQNEEEAALSTARQPSFSGANSFRQTSSLSVRLATPENAAASQGDSLPAVHLRRRNSSRRLNISGHSAMTKAISSLQSDFQNWRVCSDHRKQSFQKTATSVAFSTADVSPQQTFVQKDTATICVVAFDALGAVPILLGRGGRLAKVYSCSDHYFTDKNAKVDQLVCDGNTIAVLISNGDVRLLEFTCEEEAIPLTDVPLDFPS